MRRLAIATALFIMWAMSASAQMTTCYPLPNGQTSCSTAPRMNSAGIPPPQNRECRRLICGQVPTFYGPANVCHCED